MLSSEAAENEEVVSPDLAVLPCGSHRLKSHKN